MTKEEKRWIYMSMLVAVIIFAFLIYLISDCSPLAKSDQSENVLENLEYTPEASSEVNLAI